MFFVHGGAFYAGTSLMMDAARLGDVADVVVVSVNYRVGSLGENLRLLSSISSIVMLSESRNLYSL
jgi:carboxylesterase type B